MVLGAYGGRSGEEVRQVTQTTQVDACGGFLPPSVTS